MKRQSFHVLPVQDRRHEAHRLEYWLVACVTLPTLVLVAVIVPPALAALRALAGAL